MERGPCGGSTDGFPVVLRAISHCVADPEFQDSHEEMSPIFTRLHPGAWAASASGRTVACRAIAIKVNLLAVSA
jgi:hypothetical protein